MQEVPDDVVHTRIKTCTLPSGKRAHAHTIDPGRLGGAPKSKKFNFKKIFFCKARVGWQLNLENFQWG